MMDDEGGANPLRDDSPSAFDDLIESIGPASLLVVIESRMGRSLRDRMSSDDILQEALLHAWRDRARIEWRGLRSFRSYLLSVIDNRIRDLTDHARAEKRGGGAEPVRVVPIAPPDSSGGDRPGDGALLASTTPSRIAAYREERAAMQAAIEALPAELRDVVRLRLFEQVTLAEIASRLGIGEPAARQRFRKGAAIYRRRLEVELSSRSESRAGEFGALPRGDSSSLR